MTTLLFSLFLWYLAAPFLLILLLHPALEAVDLGSRNPLKWFAALVAYFADLTVARTIWPAIFGWPRYSEATVSHTLERLIRDPLHSDLAIPIAVRINTISKNHIQGLTAVLAERAKEPVCKPTL